MSRLLKQTATRDLDLPNGGRTSEKASTKGKTLKWFLSDVDECVNRKYKCNNNSSCENIPGSFICKCKSGFRKNHKGQCEGKQSILDQHAALTSVLNAFIVLSVSAFHVIAPKGKIWQPWNHVRERQSKKLVFLLFSFTHHSLAAKSNLKIYRRDFSVNTFLGFLARETGWKIRKKSM